MAFKMKAGKEGPMRKNFGIGSPMQVDSEKTDETEKVSDMYGTVNQDGTKIINKKGKWVSIKRGTEGAAIRDVAGKSGDTKTTTEKDNTGKATTTNIQ